MLKEDVLLTTILSTTHAERKLIVEYLKLQSKKARDLNNNDLQLKNSDAEHRDPRTPGEKIASNIFSALIQQEYVNWEDDESLAHIQDIAQRLTDKTDDRALWEELFNRINKL
jgi:hypothetical protein